MEPPSPTNILRGHSAQVHAATFTQGNARLVTGDADGFIVSWDLGIMRPRAVWRAHTSAILGVQGWGEKLITHGRDHKLIVWKVEEERMSTALPLEDAQRPQPWVVYLLEVNTMNFCAFSACAADGGSMNEADEVLVAVPHTLASESIDIYALPSQTRLHTIKTDKNGMAMCLSLLYQHGFLTLIAGFENGGTSVHRLGDTWTTTYRTQAHTQPILSLSVHPDTDSFFSSSADAIIARHPIPLSQRDGKPWEHTTKTIDTKHAGQQSLRIRSDGRIFATAGWDGRVRVYSIKSMKELAVLAWHKVGCYAVAFASIVDAGDAVTSVKDRRLQRATTAHWIAAGSKDGKVSLWEIY